MKLVIVERTLTEPVTVEQVAARLASNPCLNAHGVRLLRSLISLDGLRMVCEYEAPDAESVRQANRKSGLVFDRVWTAHELNPGSVPLANSAKG
jgi:hypothetical protein